ncbi:uncharacterized protein DNG_09426 [Cephalotrichum gorgonifer]|uniref:Uncharacterized protein n=1 Tax=Cephalotrichum gorgonifer TaxID=2041049 RepID=A0AAE8N877_9PEZI|nr:uncharacterized protein DNG_09426 [Cephalotrichum gorgonifer]
MRYWVVADGPAAAGSDRLADAGQVGRDLTAIKAKLAERKAVRVQRADGLEEIDRETEWIKRTEWARHFGIRELPPIADAAAWVCGRAAGRKESRTVMTREEARHERQQLQLGKSFDRVIDRCCWRLDSVLRATLQRLGGIAAGAAGPGVA